MMDKTMNMGNVGEAQGFDLEDFTERELVAEALRVFQVLERGRHRVYLNAFKHEMALGDRYTAKGERYADCATYYCGLGWLWIMNGGEPSRVGGSKAWDSFLARAQNVDDSGNTYGCLFEKEKTSGTIQDRIRWAESRLAENDG